MQKPYGSDPYSYDLRAALTKCEAAPKRSYWDTVALVRVNSKTAPLSAPTHQALARHAKRWGRDCVAETASVYGMTASAAELAEQTGAKRRHTSESMRAQVLALHARGAVPAAIADTLNISDRRVRQLLAQPEKSAA